MFLSQELKGRFLVKGKRLNKLETVFSDHSAAEEEETVTEEEDCRDDEEDSEKVSSEVCNYECKSPVIQLSHYFFIYNSVHRKNVYK